MTSSLSSPLVVSLVLCLTSPTWSIADEVDFSRQVLPILSNKCFVCHGPDAEDGLVRLDSYEAATADLGGYAAITSDDPSDSELVARIHSTDDPMPPEDAEKQLTDAEREILRKWITQGGEYSKHWSFVPPTRSKADSDIDSFIRSKLQERGIDLAPPADAATLARRTALVLTGLPPEAEQLEAYLENPNERAFETLVTQLLESPRYGEHQARYWLDAVRYGDTHGLHLDNRRGIFPYRDWVVRAFNQNLRLDDFVTWQLAGDLLPSSSLEQKIASGFVRLNPSTSEGGAIKEEFQAKNSFDRTESIGTVLLGLSLTCARCHTHKYDPITHTEYYQLLSFFNNTAEPPLDGNKYEYGSHLRVPKDHDSWQAFQDWQQAARQLLESLPDREETKESDDADIPVPAEQTADELLSSLQAIQSSASGNEDDSDASFSDDASNLVEQYATLEKDFTTTLVAEELLKPRVTRVLHRGEYDQPIGDPLQPDTLAVLNPFPSDAPKNRLGLAKWLTADDHPLMSRVLVNRIWQRVFGYGLVRTPEDFGLQGEQPTHPELLDWLAVELQESGWDLQHLLRLMLHSQTFQQSSAWRTDVDDPDNRLFARGPSFRLDAEVIRDMALWSSGLLDPRLGGEGVKPYQPAGMWAALAHPASNTKMYERDQGAALYRRSLYVYWKRTSPHPMMTLFDAPDRESSCVRRSRTNTSLQSLGLLNETQRVEMARQFAARLLGELDTDKLRIQRMFRLLACRDPSDAELSACTVLLENMRQRYAEHEDDAKSLLSQGDAPLVESVPIAEQAAWTQVTITVLASDIALALY